MSVMVLVVAMVVVISLAACSEGNIVVVGRMHWTEILKS